MNRLVVVSNRVAALSENKESAGGLAIGVLGALQATGGVWFGWSGDIITTTNEYLYQAPHIFQEGNVIFATVDLSQNDYNQYYKGFSNSTLWPVFHYRNDLAHFNRDEYLGYRRVNIKFVKQLILLLKPNDIIWVHDYHLIPFAEELIFAGIKNRIGYFLHIPFPAPQMILNIPVHEELVKSLCCYDIVGFQTIEDEQAFKDYIIRYAHGSIKGKEIQAYKRKLRTGVYRIGIFPDKIAKQAVDSLNHKEIQELRKNINNRKLIISVDRLDYSKGIIERLKAFEKLLNIYPNFRDQVNLLQIAPPTRSDISTYQQLQYKLEYEIGRINGSFSSLNYIPIHYLNKHFDQYILISLFRFAQVGFVTPLRDGMNLVAKEYVAAQNPENPGVLILSCFAGAAVELDAALIVNPYDIVSVTENLTYALNMSLNERCERYLSMINTLRKNNLGVWRDTFLKDLKSCLFF